MSDDTVIPFVPRQADQPDSSHVWADENGVRWFKFLCDYSHEGARWNFTIWALSLRDAQTRLCSIAANGNVLGQLYTQIDARDVTTAGLLAAGAKLEPPPNE